MSVEAKKSTSEVKAKVAPIVAIWNKANTEAQVLEYDLEDAINESDSEVDNAKRKITKAKKAVVSAKRDVRELLKRRGASFSPAAIYNAETLVLEAEETVKGLTEGLAGIRKIIKKYLG